jgi:hypothetical protein
MCNTCAAQQVLATEQTEVVVLEHSRENSFELLRNPRSLFEGSDSEIQRAELLEGLRLAQASPTARR